LSESDRGLSVQLAILLFGLSVLLSTIGLFVNENALNKRAAVLECVRETGKVLECKEVM